MPPFAPDGVYADVPYRVLPDCSIEAMTPEGLVKFENMDQFTASADGALAINNVEPSTIAPDGLEGASEAGHSTISSDILEGASEAGHSTISSDVLEGASEQKTNVAASARPRDYYSILLETIKNTEKNPARLRALVYERARFNFKQNILFGHPSMRLTDIMRHANDFEFAIDRIEANSSDGQPNLAYQNNEGGLADNIDLDAPGDQFARSASNKSGQLVPYVAPNQIQQFDNSQYDRRLDDIVPRVRFANQLIGILILGILFIGTVIVAGILWHSPVVSPQIIVANNPPKPVETAAEKSPQVSFPLPTSYGIYVLSNNKITELESLPIAIPNSRVALSAEIKKPPTTTISDDKPAFILFRRDLLNNAPPKITLRVVARMTRETKIVGGKAETTNIEGSWRIRNISREFKVSPIPGQREMIIARPDNDETLAAGRYMLVLNKIGYDFTIEGPVKSPEFCLERFEAASGSIYVQCKNP